MGSLRPRVTVVIPSHRPDMLAEAIASVHAQTVPCAMLVHYSPGEWWPSKLNEMLDLVQTEFVLVLCDDDLLEPNAVALMVQAADEHGANLVFSDYRFFGDQDWVQKAGPFTVDALRESNTLLGWSALIRTTVFHWHGTFDASLDYQDWEFWLRMARREVRAAHVPLPLVRYRKHAGCGGYQIPWAEAKAAVLRKHGFAP